jgi:hypothetical protein
MIIYLNKPQSFRLTVVNFSPSFYRFISIAGLGSREGLQTLYQFRLLASTDDTMLTLT